MKPFSAALCCLMGAGLAASGHPSGLAWPIARMNDRDRAKIEAGAAVVEVVPARNRDLAVFGVVRAAIDGDRLVAWVRHIEALQRSSYIPLARRFSSPPSLDDVRELTLDEDDLDDLRDCRPGDCGVKLSAAEIEQTRRDISAAGKEWKAAAQNAFRLILVARARSYATEGHAGTPPYHDHDVPVSPGQEFDALSHAMGLDALAPANLVRHLRSYPLAGSSGAESFLYWSKETLGGAKPIVSITHATIFPPPAGYTGETTVAFKQVYASHYLTASLSLTAVIGEKDGGPRHLVYARRSRADVLSGPFGGIVRNMIERRIRSEAPPALNLLRRRLESEPPGASTPSS